MKLTIDRSIWLRGEGHRGSKLFRLRDNKMTVGILLLYKINNDADAVREQSLTETFAEGDIEVTFVDGPTKE